MHEQDPFLAKAKLFSLRGKTQRVPPHLCFSVGFLFIPSGHRNGITAGRAGTPSPRAWGDSGVCAPFSKQKFKRRKEMWRQIRLLLHFQLRAAHKHLPVHGMAEVSDCSQHLLAALLLFPGLTRYNLTSSTEEA